MDMTLRRLTAGAIGGALLLSLITGCTLTGAKAAPSLTPVAQDTGGLVGSPTPTTGLPLIPSPTQDTGPVDVFGTQTALAPLAETPGGLVETPATGTTPGAETPTPPPTLTPIVSQEAASEVECPKTHVVQKGENLFRIALKYGLTVDELAAANGITNPDKIQAGTVLKIPYCKNKGEQIYVVQPGDTLYRIALKFGITWQELAAYNNIKNPDAIYVGQVLKIPPKKSKDQ